MENEFGLEFVISVNGDRQVLTEANCTIYIFTQADVYNHVYWTDDAGECHVFFEQPQLIQILQSLEFPERRQRYPTAWDEQAFSQYLDQQFDRELEEGIDGQAGD